MLTIYTDLSDDKWLVYLLEEFKRINRAQFHIQVSNINDLQEQSCSLVYTKDPMNKNSIYNCHTIEPGELSKVDSNLYIYQNTKAHSREYLINYDLFWNAFLILSRYEEYAAEKEGLKIRSYCSRHPRKDKASFKFPLVNIFFNQLETIITELYPELNFSQEKEFRVDPSHDVDYIDKTFQLILKQTAFNGFNTFRSILTPGKFFSNLKKTVVYPFKRPSYFCFDYWKNFEKRNGTRSVFYFYVRNNKRSLKQWLLDPSYNISSNKKLQEKIQELIADGFEIGLHGSFNSAFDDKLLREEKDTLEKIIGRPVKRTRQHWLNYSEFITPGLHDKNFEVDSTLGWNDSMGFRSGCASKHRPWDHKNNRPFSYYIVPQVLMDSTIFDYSQSYNDVEEAINMLKKLKDHKNVYVSISWHQRTCSSDYNWHLVYERIINECL